MVIEMDPIEVTPLDERDWVIANAAAITYLGLLAAATTVYILTRGK